MLPPYGYLVYHLPTGPITFDVVAVGFVGGLMNTIGETLVPVGAGPLTIPAGRHRVDFLAADRSLVASSYARFDSDSTAVSEYRRPATFTVVQPWAMVTAPGAVHAVESLTQP